MFRQCAIVLLTLSSYLSYYVCLIVNKIIWKMYELILMKFTGSVDNGPQNRWSLDSIFMLHYRCKSYFSSYSFLVTDTLNRWNRYTKKIHYKTDSCCQFYSVKQKYTSISDNAVLKVHVLLLPKILCWCKALLSCSPSFLWQLFKPSQEDKQCHQ